MNLLENILGNSSAISQISKQLGLPEEATKKAAAALTPALSRGIERNAAKPGGLDSLLGALNKGDHAKYVEQPETLAKAETVTDGNAILGHIFGNKDVSRNVAGSAAKQTGLDASILKKMLPMLAPVVMGMLSKQSGGGANLAGLTGGGGQSDNPLGMLTGFLDSDKDGSAQDELLSLAKKFF